LIAGGLRRAFILTYRANKTQGSGNTVALHYFMLCRLHEVRNFYVPILHEAHNFEGRILHEVQNFSHQHASMVSAFLSL
jgi:hypothetical protein